MKLTAFASSLFLAASVSAHATFQDFWVGGTDMVSTCDRLPVSNSPVTSVTSNDIACNAGASASPGLCTVAAGGAVTVEMHQQPGDRTCTTEAIGGNHDGPVIVYMAKVDNALTAVGSSAAWFKVAELGLISIDVWGTDSLNSNCGKFTFNIPSCIPAGQYLVRAEVIALHVAGSVGGAQFYMSCYTINVTGGGSASPATVSFPGAYSATDPGILFDLYGGYTSYTIPGPAVFTCGTSTGTSSTSVRASSSSSTSRASSTSSTRASSTSSTRASSSSSTSRASSSSAASTGTAPLYGQCGGSGWTGATTCASGTCTYSNAWYSQCLP